MKFFLAMLLWVVMAALLAGACVLAVTKTVWPLVGLVALFFFLMGKIGCLSSH